LRACGRSRAPAFIAAGIEFIDEKREELRFDAANGVWRVAFAFDPRRQGILLVVGDKSGVSQGRFYEQFIAKADKRYTAHLARLKKASAKKG
jgi:hypothetical protein